MQSTALAPRRRRTAPLAATAALLAGAFLWALSGPAGNTPVRAQEDDRKGPDVRPGLIAIHSDGTHTAVRFDSEPSFLLKAGESPDPRVGGDAFTSTWEGSLNVLRRGKYRFAANVIGSVTVTVGGKEVLSAQGAGEAVRKTGDEVELEPGPAALKIAYRKQAGPARLQLFWEGRGFRSEPLPASVLVHAPAAETPEVKAGTLIDRGRHLVEEFSCAACHKPAAGDKLAAGLQNRKAPTLVPGLPFKPAWVYHWLGNPQDYRPHTQMPQVFTDDDNGKLERAVLAKYLTGQKPEPPPLAKPGNAGNGEKLFQTIGCAVCHGANPAAGGEAHISIRGAGSKGNDKVLADWLLNPAQFNPHTRMPNMLLEKKDAEDISAYLVKQKQPALEALPPDLPGGDALAAAYRRVAPEGSDTSGFSKLNATQQINTLGRAIAQARNCLTCHTLREGNKTFDGQGVATNFAAIRTGAGKGCLSKTPDAKTPRFTMADADREVVAAFLAHGSTGAGAPAPTFAAKALITKLNCLGCHQRSGTGGLTLDFVAQLQKFEKSENAEAVNPPSLTQVGYKIKVPWMNEVLTAARRARPWMVLRMPQFSKQHVGPLAAGLAACDGVGADDPEPPLPFDAKMVRAGQTLVGKNGFGCVSCHDVAGRPAVGTRGPDLASVIQRVRPEWFERWMYDPQRLAPGTRMPTVHIDGKTTLKDVLAGDLEQQISAMRQYLSLGDKMPLPEGVNASATGKNAPIEVFVADKPVLERCFMQEAGAHSIAIGFPGGTSIAYDAYNCKAVFGWSGGFLDMRAMWADRGGQPARPLGGRFWTAPEGFPWAVTSVTSEIPDWDKQAKDKTINDFAAQGERPDHPRRLHYKGYSLKPTPTFRFTLEGTDGKESTFRERLESVSQGGAIGFARTFEYALPAGQTAWLLAGRSTEPMKVIGGTPVEDTAEVIEQPVAGTLLVVPGKGQTVVIRATAPADARWVLQKAGAGRTAMLRLPAAGTVRLEVLAPLRADAAVLDQLIKDLGK